MTVNLFLTYSTDENRVTASILAVFQSISLDHTQRLLGALLDASEFELVNFQTQPGKGGPGVPDAIIQSSCRILIETKIKRNAIKSNKLGQIERHLDKLYMATESVRLLIILTPDDACPLALGSLQSDRLVWVSFSALDQAIEGMLEDRREVFAEREVFLLRELQNMLAVENLLASDKDVVIVPARHAWPEYQQYHAYVCQADRKFRQTKRMAFYCHGEIQQRIPQIVEPYHPHIRFVHGEHKGRLGELIDVLLNDGVKKEGEIHGVFILSPTDAPETLNLEHPIKNDLTSIDGKPIAFTQNQRYVSSDRMKTAKTTSQLVDNRSLNWGDE